MFGCPRRGALSYKINVRFLIKCVQCFAQISQYNLRVVHLTQRRGAARLSGRGSRGGSSRGRPDL